MKASRKTGQAPARLAAAAAAAALVLLAVYAPALHGGWLWDDDFYVSKNGALHDLDGLRRIWLETGTNPQYYPLTFTTYWIEEKFWGLDPTGYHVVNVLLHAATAVLLWRLLRRLALPGAWLAAALFALHPIQVESVAWVTERKNTLSGLLYVLAATVWLRWALRENPPERTAARGKDDWREPAMAALLFFGALLSKSVTASLPVILAVVVWWKRGRLERRHLPSLGLMLAAGAAKGLLTAVLEVRQVGAQGAEWSLTLLDRALLAGRIFWFYLGKLVWPAGLSFSYERWPVHATSPAWWCWAPAAAAAVAVLWAARERIGRGPAAAALFYGITLSPALGFLNVYPMRYAWVADHFAYLAMIGPAAAAAAAWARLAAPPGRAGAARAAAGAALAALAFLSWRQAHAYKDLETLWRDAVAKCPRSWLAHFDLGKLLLADGRTAEATEHLRRSLDLKPDNVDALNDVAGIALDRGRTAEALALYDRALALDPESPLTLFNRGVALEAAGDSRGAEASYRDSVRLSGKLAWRYRGGTPPFPWRAQFALGSLLRSEGRPSEAEAAYRAAIESNPDAPEPHAALGSLLAAAGRRPEALEAFRRGAAAAPGFAPLRFNLAVALEESGDLDGAAAEYRAAAQADPALGDAWNNLAVVLYRKGDYRGSLAAAREAAKRGRQPHPDFLRALSGKISGGAAPPESPPAR